jgi:hypothetical protein
MFIRPQLPSSIRSRRRNTVIAVQATRGHPPTDHKNYTAALSTHGRQGDDDVLIIMVSIELSNDSQE